MLRAAAHQTRRPAVPHRQGRVRRAGVVLKSQERKGHTREPDPTHNELKHTATRKTATQPARTAGLAPAPSGLVARMCVCGCARLWVGLVVRDAYEVCPFVPCVPAY